MGTQEFQNKLMSLQGNLLNFAYMLTSNRDNAYDLLQDTTLKATMKANMLITPTSKAGFSPSCATFSSTTTVAWPVRLP